MTPRRIYDLTGTSPLLSTVIICQLKFLGHILLKEKDEPANIYALFEPLTGEHPQGDCISLFPAKFGIEQFSEDDIVRTQLRPSQLETTHSQLLFGQPMLIFFFGQTGWPLGDVCRCLVNSFGRAPIYWAGSRGFKPWLGQHSGSLNNWGESAAFAATSANGSSSSLSSSLFKTL